MALLIKTDIDRANSWRRAFAKYAPHLDVRDWEVPGDLADIKYALVWEPPSGALKQMPNLEVIFSIGAGIDHLASDRDLPEGVPIVRMVESGLTAGMTEFVVMSVLYHHRFMLDYANQQRESRWREIEQIPTARRRVGIMGLGVLGGDAARRLLDFGFPLAGWSRNRKDLPGVESFHGQEGLTPFLARTDILVCLLPLTPETDGLLDARVFDALPDGAVLISVGRGKHVVEDDLLAALDSGKLRGATLDVFRNEPLPPDSPFWSHPRVVVTPHVASMTIPDTAAESVLANIARFEAGEPLDHVVDLKRGY